MCACIYAYVCTHVYTYPPAPLGATRLRDILGLCCCTTSITSFVVCCTTSTTSFVVLYYLDPFPLPCVPSPGASIAPPPGTVISGGLLSLCCPFLGVCWAYLGSPSVFFVSSWLSWFLFAHLGRHFDLYDLKLALRWPENDTKKASTWSPGNLKIVLSLERRAHFAKLTSHLLFLSMFRLPSLFVTLKWPKMAPR